jgi:acetyl esterase
MTLSSSYDLLSNESFKTFIEEFGKLFSNDLSLPQMRKLCTDFFLPKEDAIETIQKIENLEIEGKDNNKIPIRLFIPGSTKILPVMVYFHRGGFVFGNIEEADPICRKLANHFNCIVASVDYRLAPEHPFPKPLEDCYAATKWIANNALLFGGDKDKVSVAGESAGGNLAASVAIMSRDNNEFKLHSQLLIYPMITPSINDAIYDASVDRYFITKQGMRLFWNLYLQSSDVIHPYASLDDIKDLSHLPPTCIITAEYDPMHQEAQHYAKRLSQAGVVVITKCFPEVIHGFLDLPIYDNHQKTQWIKEIHGIMGRYL